MEFTVIAEGLGFPDGPVVMADGSVIVVEIMAGRISRCWNGKTEVVCEPGGGPNGAAIGPDGALYVCNNGGMGEQWHGRDDWAGRVERVDLATGRCEVLYHACEGRPLSAPNDIMFDSEGNMWFTDLGRLEPELKRFGGLYCARPDGSAIIRVMDKAVAYNGVGISPDMSTVYVSDTVQARLYAFDRRAEAQKPRLVATVPGLVGLDSLAMTAAGNICVATICAFEGGAGAISTVTPQGAVCGIATPDPVTTNIAFGGADMRDAFITCSMHGTLVKARWGEAGMPLVYNA